MKLKLLSLAVGRTYRRSCPIRHANLENITKVIPPFTQYEAQGKHTTSQDNLRYPCTNNLVRSAFLKGHFFQLTCGSCLSDATDLCEMMHGSCES